MLIYGFGGISDDIFKSFEVVRFIDSKDLLTCQKGTFLIGSIARNKAFDDARGDQGEMTVSIRWSNTEQKNWEFQGEECQRYLGIHSTKKITGISGRGGITMANQCITQGNPLSLSLGLVLKDNFRADLNRLRLSLGMSADAVALRFKCPNDLILKLTNKLSQHLGDRKIIPIAGPISYARRDLVCNSFENFKETIKNVFANGVFDIDLHFRKPPSYESDRELRVLWVAHSGPTNLVVQAPIHLDYQANQFVIVEGINFQDNFDVVN